jgi:hypothetical protein
MDIFNREKYDLVFSSGLIANNAVIDKESRTVINKYTTFCEKLITGNPASKVDDLCDSAKTGFRYLKKYGEIPVINTL